MRAHLHFYSLDADLNPASWLALKKEAISGSLLLLVELGASSRLAQNCGPSVCSNGWPLGPAGANDIAALHLTKYHISARRLLAERGSTAQALLQAILSFYFCNGGPQIAQTALHHAKGLLILTVFNLSLLQVWGPFRHMPAHVKPQGRCSADACWALGSHWSRVWKVSHIEAWAPKLEDLNRAGTNASPARMHCARPSQG